MIINLWIAHLETFSLRRNCWGHLKSHLILCQSERKLFLLCWLSIDEIAYFLSPCLICTPITHALYNVQQKHCSIASCPTVKVHEVPILFKWMAETFCYSNYYCTIGNSMGSVCILSLSTHSVLQVLYITITFNLMTVQHKILVCYSGKQLAFSRHLFRRSCII